MQRKYIRILGPLLGIALLIVALSVLYHKFQAISLQDIVREFSMISHTRLLIAALLTACYYAFITAYDTLAMRFIGHPLHYSRIALAAFTGYSFGHNIGFSVISGGSVRYRVLSSFGLTATEIGKVLAFAALSFWIGFLFMCGLAFLFLPIRIPDFLQLPFENLRLVGCIALVAVFAYGWLTTHTQHGRKIGSLEIPKLTPRIFGLQLLIGSIDWLLACSVIFALLPQAQDIGFLQFFEIFILAQVAGLISQVPGGIGIFESVLLALLPSEPSLSAATISVLLVYRIIFYLLPLLIAILLLATHEVRIAKRIEMTR